MIAQARALPLRVGTIAAGLVLAAFVLGPIVWMINSSFQLDRDLFTSPPHLIPQQPTLDNYRYIITRRAPPTYSGQITGRRASGEALSIIPALRNSFIVSLSFTLITLL